MKNMMLACLCASFTFPVGAQMLLLQATGNSNSEDSAQVFATVGIDLKGTYVKPPTVYRLKSSSNILEPDEESEKWRYMPKGQLGILVRANKDPEAKVQMHLFFELSALPTRMSVKYGLGSIFYPSGFGFGTFAHNYRRRIDDYGDESYRAKQFSSGWSAGLYGIVDRPLWSLGVSVSQEKTAKYFEARTCWKIGRAWPKSFVPGGLEIVALVESYFGTGGGFSCTLFHGHCKIGVSYLVIDLAEEKTARKVNQELANGGVVQVSWFAF